MVGWIIYFFLKIVIQLQLFNRELIEEITPPQKKEKKEAPFEGGTESMTRALNLSSGLAAFVSLKNIWRPVEGQSGVKYYLPGDTVMVFLLIPPPNVFAQI